MNVDERIEAALRRRPSAERAYDEPLAALTEPSGRPERARALVQVRAPKIRSSVPALGAVCLVLILGAGVVTVALIRNAGPAAGPTSTGTPFPTSSLVGCWGREPGFSPELLAGAGDAETGNSPAAAVLRSWLASGQGELFPDQGWHLVSEKADEVLFVAKAAGGDVYEYQEATVQRSTAGQFGVDGWSLGPYGSCMLRAIPPSGYGAATWRLDPAFPLAADTIDLHILVTEEACHGTVAATEDRIRADVGYESTAVVVTITVRSDEGVWTCPTAPPASYVVHLSEPLGNRDLLNGGPWPAVTVASGDRPAASATPAPSVQVETSGQT
jgi:hypothetical protein